jgi:23S rRNA (uracil1939-C5)-methyltransferase
MARYGVLRGLPIEAVLPTSSLLGYRVRAKLMIDIAKDARRGVAMGLFAKGSSSFDESDDRADSHEVIDIPHCRVLHPALGRAAAVLRAALARADAPSTLLPVGAGGRLSALDLRWVEGDSADAETAGLLLTFVMEGGPPLEPGSAEAIVDVARGLGTVVGVAVNYRDRGAPQVLGPSTQRLWGVSSAPDRVAGAYHLATYGSFVQANRSQAEQLIELIAAEFGHRRALGQSRILDLYGGSGAMSLPLARRGAQVTLVEAFAPAAEFAGRAAREQGFAGFGVCVGDATAVTGALVREHAKFDAVIANPPRRGLAPAVRRAISKLEPAVVVYVSCDPDTLARDLSDLAWLGYRAVKLFPVDMMPLTSHVEVLAVLERGPSPTPDILHRDDHGIAVAKRAQETAVEALARVHRPAAGEGLKAVEWAPDEDESGPLLIRSPTERGAPRDAWFADYIALVRGVTRKRGTLVGARYERVAIARGHSLLWCHSEGPSKRMRQSFAHIGHPVVGDRRFGDRATNRYFEEKHTLDRLFLHCIRVQWSRPRPVLGSEASSPKQVATIACPLSDELAAVLAKFEIDAVEQLVIG